jgi:hypothetical protein
MKASFATRRESRCTRAGGGRAGSGRSAAASARAKRAAGVSWVVPCTRASAATIQRARCASSAAKSSNARPARPLCLTYFTPDSVLPLVRAR